MDMISLAARCLTPLLLLASCGPPAAGALGDVTATRISATASPTPSPVPATPSPSPTPQPTVQAATARPTEAVEAPLEQGKLTCFRRKSSLAVKPEVYLGRRMAAQMGWTGSEWAALHRLWSCESSWRTNATYRGKTWGIPQAYPGKKMASMGADWRTNPATQIKWGLQYIKARYGRPSKAWATFQKKNAY